MKDFVATPRTSTSSCAACMRISGSSRILHARQRRAESRDPDADSLKTGYVTPKEPKGFILFLDSLSRLGARFSSVLLQEVDEVALDAQPAHRIDLARRPTGW